MKDGINNEENTQQNKTKKSLGTGAKVAIASLGVLALLGGGIIATLAGIDFIEDCKESKNAESLVSICIDSDRLVTLPEQIIVDREYDVKYCSGEKLIEELTEANAQYCCIDGQYYTEKGETIAILKLEVTRTETVDALVADVDGSTVYIPRPGYTSNGATCTREIVTYETKVVPKNKNNDYREVFVEGATKVVLLGYEEVDTKKYSSLSGFDLICDVADGAELKDNACPATLILKRR